MNKTQRNPIGLKVKSFGIRLVVFTLLSMISTMNYGQTGDKNSIAYPSANNNSLPRNISDDVDLYQGKVNINIPLHTIQTTNLSVPVSLSYEGGNGIKVQEIASQVGLGWKIKAGGYITRIVRGLPDEDPKGYIGTGDAGHKVNETLNNTTIDRIGIGEIDGEPDLFILVTPSFELTFVFDPNGNPVFNKTKGIQITHNLRSNGGDINNTNWIVKDLDGTIYKFGSKTDSRESLTIKLNNDTKNFVSTWYLDQMSSPNLIDQINFEYIAGNTYSFTDQRLSKLEYEGFGSCQKPPSTFIDKVQYTFESPKYVSKIHNSITELRFNYLNDRRDINASRLESIYLYSSSNTNHRKGFKFSYSYFGPSSGSTDELRLKLDAIRLEGSFPNSNLLHFASFKYNMNENLPNRNSHEFDYSGYYNINASGSSFPPEANKEPNNGRAQANILNEIRSITGDITTIFYEPNTIFDSNAGQNIDISGLRVSAIVKSSSGKAFRTEYHYHEGGKSSGKVVNENYKKFRNTFSMLVVIPGNPIGCVITGNMTSSTSLFNSVEAQGNIVGYSKVKTLYPNLSYNLKQFSNIDTFPDEYTPSNSDGSIYSIDNSAQVGSRTSYSFKRGLLSKENLYEPNGQPIKETIYNYTSLNSPTKGALGVKVILLRSLNGGIAYLWTYGTYKQVTDYYALSHKTEIDYDRTNAASGIVLNTDYTYTSENINLLKTVDALNSKQQTLTTVYLHPQDMLSQADDPTGVYNAMVNNNILAPIIGTRTSKKTSASTVALLSKTQKFFTPSPLMFVPGSKSEKKGLDTEFISSLYTKYDSYGHVIESEQLQGPTSSYLYDSITQLLIGKADNATLNDIAYTSFESYGVGNWNIPERPQSIQKAITGTRSALIDDYTRLSKANLDPSKQYVLTYWVNGNNLPKITTHTVIPANLIRTKGDWRQYQCIFSNATIVKVDSEQNQTVILDELRLQPYNASMVTYTHDLAAGITSITDMRGQISYYNYDDYLRLKEIRDFDQNIIESYEYYYHTPIN